VGFLSRGLAESDEGFEGNGGHRWSQLELRVCENVSVKSVFCSSGGYGLG
jgi:muramoyltetrapeptide carboxypeptidase LdcA involved in peptidoglycan recycling